MLIDFHHVRHVPKVARNLISLGVLDDSGYVKKIEGGSMKICKGSMVVIKGIKKEGLYYLVCYETPTQKQRITQE